MPSAPVPLLLPHEIDHAIAIGRAIREGRVAAFVGAGLSLDAGLPTWPELTERLIRAWHDWDPTPGVHRLSPPNYVRLIRDIFGQNDLAFISHLRRSLPRVVHRRRGPAPAFSDLLYRALYSGDEQGGFIYPVPSDAHRHLVALFAEHPGHLWTTNYDDLLERAAAELGLDPQPLELERHRVRRGLLITHLHGYLPPLPPDQLAGGSIAARPVVLAEDDYHAVAAGRAADRRVDTTWIGNEFYRLFHEHQVLMLGMSLTDPNLRRVLATLATIDPGGAPEAAGEPTHHAVLTPLSPGSLALRRVRTARREQAASAATRMRAAFWAGYGLGIVDLSTYERLPSFLVRLRYESGGAAVGDLWRQGGRRGYGALRPWDAGQQARAEQLLARVIDRVRRQFGVPVGEIVDVGIFLLRPGRSSIELVFRSGRSPAPAAGGRTFSVDPDAPSGVAGCAFVTGVGMRMDRNHALHDFQAPPSAGTSAPYEGLIVAPLVDWTAGGVPLGVIYATVATTAGRLFAVSEHEVVNLLGDLGRAVLAALLDTSGGATGHVLQ